MWSESHGEVVAVGVNSYGNGSEVAGDARQITSEDRFIARRERRRDVKGPREREGEERRGPGWGMAERI
jgi:hypothetical protein